MSITFPITHRAVRAAILSLCLLVMTGLIPGSHAEGIPIAELNRTTLVDFEKEVLPILRKNCLACHGSKKPKGGLILETPQTILKGGDSGEAVVPGKGMESYLLEAAAHLDEDTIMPPKDNKVNARDFTSEELALLKLWIDQGAKGDVRTAQPVNWNVMPDLLKSIHAVAITEDGQFAACSRANQVYVYHLPSQRLVARLDDPKLKETEFYKETGAAHLDLVQSLTFSADGNRLASGGYRVIKLWKRIKGQPGLTLALGQDKPLAAAAASHHGKWLATVQEGGAVTLWNLVDGKQLRQFGEASFEIRSLAFSPDDKILLAGAKDGKVRLWNPEDGALVREFSTPSDVRVIAFANARPITGGSDTIIRLWDIPEAADGEVKATLEFKGHEGPVTALTVQSDHLFSGSDDGSVRIWNLADAKMIRKIDNGSPVLSLAARPDGKRIVAAGKGNAAKLFNADDGKLVADLKGDRYASEAVARSERQAALAAAEVNFRKSDLEGSEKSLKAADERLKKADEAFASADKALGEKAKLFADADKAKGDADKALAGIHADVKRVTDAFKVADDASKQAEMVARNSARKSAEAEAAARIAEESKSEAEKFLADAESLLAKARTAASVSGLSDAEKAAANKRVENADAVVQKTKVLFESAAAEAEAKNKAAEAVKEEADTAIAGLTAKAFAAGQVKVDFDAVTKGVEDRLKNATNTVNEAVKKLNAATGERDKAQTAKTQAETEKNLATKAQDAAKKTVEGAKTAFAASEKSKTDADATVKAAKDHATASEKPVWAVAFADALSVATTGEAGGVQTWSSETGTPFEVYPVETKPQQLVTLGQNRILSVSKGNAQVLDLNQRWELDGVLGTGGVDSPIIDRVNALNFSADGKLLASGGGEPSRSGEVMVWNVEDGKLIHHLTDVHSDTVLGIQFSPDASLLASGATDKFARVIDLKTGKVDKSFEGHTHHVMGVGWKADGRTLATSGADKMIKVWDYRNGSRKKNIAGFNKEVTSIQFVGITDETLVTAGDNRVRLLKEDGKEVRSFSDVSDFQHAAAITPDGKWVVAGGEASILRFWDGTSGKLITAFERQP